MSKITYIPNRVIDENGISDGANINVYQSGGTTPVSLFSDRECTTPISNPVVVAAGALIPPIYTTYTGAVRVRVVASDGSVPLDEDPYMAIDPDAIVTEEGDSLQTFRTPFGMIISQSDAAPEVVTKAAAGDADSSTLSFSGTITADPISTTGFGLRARSLTVSNPIVKNADGVLWTHSGNYGRFDGTYFYGTGHTGANLYLTGEQTDLIHCNSQDAEDEALSSEGSVHIFGGSYITNNSNAAIPDIRIGIAGEASLYSALIGVRTTQHEHGIYEIDTGSTFRVGSQFGHLTIDKSGSPPAGINGGHTIGCRITGDVICNISSSTWSSNLVASGYDVTFGAGTASHSFGPSNQVGPTDNVNNLGNNASYICVNRGDGAAGLGGPILAYGASGPSAQGAGAEWWIGVSASGGAPDKTNGRFGTPGYLFAKHIELYRQDTGARFSFAQWLNAKNVAIGDGGGYYLYQANSTGHIFMANAVEQLRVDSAKITFNNLIIPEYVNDTAAQAGGVAAGQLYRTGSNLRVRQSTANPYQGNCQTIEFVGTPNAAHTGNTSLTTLTTVTLPAGIMGAHGRVEVTADWGFVGTAAGKTIRTTFGGNAIVGIGTSSTSLSARTFGSIANNASESAQLQPHGGVGFTSNTSAYLTPAVNTASPVDIVFDAQLGSAADTVRLLSYRITVYRRTV